MLIRKEGYKDGKGKPRVRVWLQCNDCQAESITSIDNYYIYCKRHGDDITYCKPCSAKRGGDKVKGRPSKLKGIPKPYMQKEKSANWNGGRYISPDGYYMVLIKSGPNETSGWSKYRKEHQVIAEQILGRPLQDKEVVHHIDGNKLNNSVENLDIIDNDKNHHRLTHVSLQEVGYELFKLGIIGYSKETHTYFIKDKQ